jgi:hypothetical protein
MKYPNARLLSCGRDQDIGQRDSVVAVRDSR